MHQSAFDNPIANFDTPLLHKIADLEAHINSLNAELELYKRNTKIAPIEYIFVFANKCNQKIWIKDIIMVKSESNYSVIFTHSGEKILTSKTLKYWQMKSQDSDLIRVHASYLVNRKYIKSIILKDKKINLSLNYQVTYSATYKHTLQKYVHQ
jgi:two-component system LytT family response regulator